MRILLAAAIASLLFAGCSDAPAAHALELRSDAERVATALDSTSELVALFGAEWTNETIGEEYQSDSPEIAAMNQGADDNLGDGKANAWAFMFSTADDPILVILDSGGKVLSAQRISRDSETADTYDSDTPIGPVAINSIEAAGIVRENSDTFVNIIDHDDAVVVMALGSDDDAPNPVWMFAAFTEQGDQFSISFVDAETGDYSDFSEFSEFWESWGT